MDQYFQELARAWDVYLTRRDQPMQQTLETWQRWRQRPPKPAIAVTEAVVYEDQIARAMRSCGMVALVEGQRTITIVPTAAPDKRREGRIDAEGYRERVWRGGTISEVVRDMNDALGAVDDGKYHVTE